MINPEDILHFTRNLLPAVHKRIRESVSYSPEVAFSRIPDPEKDPNNQPLRIDYFAEDLCRVSLEGKFKRKILVAGEESLKKEKAFQDLTNDKIVVALMDIVDGTDLLLRGLSNWCSATVFFYPPDTRILASVVSDHDGNVFFASDSGAFWQPRSHKNELKLDRSLSPKTLDEACIRFVRGESSGPSTNSPLSNSSICFYGQKPPNFLSTNVPTFMQKMDDLSRKIHDHETPAPALRIYNLGGIPMMLKVANGTMDAVFDLARPKPHDMVPGAYIALKARAFLGDMSGKPIGEDDLAKALLRPNDDGPAYILAGTETLYRELLDCLTS
jgi:fructose-1,6-bisphosphatase/inositol monophosphatase family enzyme